MEIEVDAVAIAGTKAQLQGTLMAPARELPGILFVHGWGGSQSQDLARAREAAGLGSICLTFDLRGHEAHSSSFHSVTREDNLEDLLAAYDWLVQQPSVDVDAIAVVGVSYGGYLAALLSSLRPVRWLALRSPAIYKDEQWTAPKLELHVDADLPGYRRRRIPWSENRALRACANYSGDVLIVEADHDEIVPHMVIENYIAAFSQANSLTSRRITDADHAFSPPRAQKDYTDTLIKWLTEMIVGGRQAVAKTRLEEHKQSGAVA
jgi:dienelactone hydrolase